MDFARSISSTNRRAMRASPSRSASCCPSFSAATARAMLPLPRKVPALRKIRAYASPFCAASMTTVADNETLDAILGGQVSVIQPRRGYRFSIDAVLLGRFVQARRADRVLELGAGSGVISLIVSRLAPPREIVAIDIQPEMAKLAARNAVLNRVEKFRSICADLRDRHIDGAAVQSFDLVLANPPYRASGAGRESPVEGRRVARGESGATLKDFVVAARRYLRDGGRAAFVFWAPRSAELIGLLRTHALEPKRIRFVHPRIDEPASSVLVEARAGGGIDVRIEPPLVLYTRKGIYTDGAREMLAGR